MKSFEQKKLTHDFISNLIEKSLNEIYVFDANTLKFLFVNHGACLNLGYSQEEMFSLDPVDIKPEYSKAEFDKVVESLRDGLKEIIIFETFHERKDKSRYPVEVHLQMLDFRGERCFVAIILDITKRKLKEDEIKEINKKLERSNDELTHFAYKASHDLKAPLSTIKNLANFMKEDLIDQNYEEVSKNIDQIVSQSHRLENLVTDILKLAKADLKETKVEKLNLLSLVQSVIDRNLDFCQSKKVKIILDIPELIEASFEKTRIQQIVENLLHNSIKYSSPEREERYVKISAFADDELVIKVEDNGIGIPANKQHEVFKMFTRFHPEIADGSGLGMSIVKKGVEALGGEITFSSSSSGTVFLVSIPNGELS